jgi:hypothetical protein
MLEHVHDDDRVLFWAPRLLGLLFAVFVSLFALDAFSEGGSLLHRLFAFGMHLIPGALVAGVVAAAWRWPLVGFFGFGALAAVYLVSAWGRFAVNLYLVIAGPMLLASVLFLLDWASAHRHVRTAHRHMRAAH